MPIAAKSTKPPTEAGKIIRRIVKKYGISKYRLGQLLGGSGNTLYKMEFIESAQSYRLIQLLLYMERYGLKVAEEWEATNEKKNWRE